MVSFEILTPANKFELSKPTWTGVITSTESNDCYMPCDEQGVWIGPRSDNLDNGDDAVTALKRFEDELAEFERLGEERWAAGDNNVPIQVSPLFGCDLRRVY